MKENELKGYFRQIEADFNQAVVSNNLDEIKKCITKDWVLIERL